MRPRLSLRRQLNIQEVDGSYTAEADKRYVMRLGEWTYHLEESGLRLVSVTFMLTLRAIFFKFAVLFQVIAKTKMSASITVARVAMGTGNGECQKC